MDSRTSRWETWLAEQRLDASLRRELTELVQRGAQEELAERFGSDLAFGTGGLRAKMGVGTARMNVHTVRRATAGVAGWLRKVDGDAVVIGYDGRRDSHRFALDCGLLLTALGLRVHLFTRALPTPLLSYAVRELGASAGIMVTASHNPPIYNGYKVYGRDGCQLLPEQADTVVEEMAAVGDLFALLPQDEEQARAQGALCDVPDAVVASYLERVSALTRPQVAQAGLRIVYTPLHGVGGAVVPEALRRAGFSDVREVASQMALDPEFTHTKSPNPEEAAAYERGLEQAAECAADIVLATDPDCDRVGLAARRADGTYRLYSGNEIGGLILGDWLDHLDRTGQLQVDSTLVTTHVTSGFGEAIARLHGVRTVRTLTGFKYIGARIAEFERSGSGHFVFGYEESVGYLALPHVRDKDGVQGAILIANMAAQCKLRGQAVDEWLDLLFAEIGYFLDLAFSFAFAGMDGQLRMQEFMDDLRSRPLTFDGLELTQTEDCRAGTVTDARSGHVQRLDLPASDVLRFIFGDDVWVAARPSGTEPKLKFYGGFRGSDRAQTEALRERVEEALRARLAAYVASLERTT